MRMIVIKNDEKVVLNNNNFEQVYKEHKTALAKFCRLLNLQNGIHYNADDVDDLINGFFCKVLSDNILKKFDEKRAKNAKNPFLYFLQLRFRSFYSSELRKRKNQAKLLENFSEANKVQSFRKSQTGVAVSAQHYGSNSSLYGDTYREDYDFCCDFKKIKYKFVRSLLGIERRIYRVFKDQIFDADAKIIAKKLKVSLKTAYRLKENIKFKAKRIMIEYAGDESFIQ